MMELGQKGWMERGMYMGKMAGIGENLVVVYNPSVWDLPRMYESYAIEDS